jgi:hypothetical protein
MGRRTALLDRITDRVDIVETGTESYRFPTDSRAAEEKTRPSTDKVKPWK